jgi:exopolysaccharide production protein ExoQ
MIASTINSTWTDYRASTLSTPRAAVEKIAIGFLTLSLLLSFLQYCFERNDLVRLVPIVFLLAGAFLCLLISPRLQRRHLLMSVLRPWTLASITIVTLPPIVSSLFYRPTLYPFQYGIVMIVTLAAIRILLSEIGFEGLLLSFFYATTVSFLIVIGISFSDLLASIGSARFAPLYFDPNRIGFFAVTAIPAQLWYAMRCRRFYVLLMSALCVFVMVAASSRGSIGALLIGGLFMAFLYTFRQARSSPFTISINKLMGTLTLLCVFTVVAGFEQRNFASAGEYLRVKLALDDRDRGLNTGFTGRTTGWAELVNMTPKTPWPIGNGYRTSDQDFDFSVDNGFIAGFYELGLFSTIVVLAKYIFVVYLLSVVYFRNALATGTCLPALLFTLVVFFANAFVHRVFFGIGEQASILAVFAFISTKQDILREVISMMQAPIRQL